jgi:hypothetical protein
MKAPINCFVLIVITILSSSSTSAEPEIPTCLQKKIASVLAEPVLSPPGSIPKYLYRGKSKTSKSTPYQNHKTKIFSFGTCLLIII